MQEIHEIPAAIREKYKVVFEIEPQWLIKAAAYRGRWIDQSQSLNIFYGGTSGKILSEIYQYAWSLGLKTTYYLRTLGASRVEKSTLSMSKFGGTSKTDAKPEEMAGTASSIIVEEMVTVISQGGLENSTPSEVMSVGEVVTVVETKQVEAGQLELIEQARKAPLKPGPAPLEPLVSNGVPSFGEKTVIAGPKVEIIGEVCESCSA